MTRKDHPVELEPVAKVIVSQLADGRAIISVHTEPIRHYITKTLLLSARNKETAMAAAKKYPITVSGKKSSIPSGTHKGGTSMKGSAKHAGNLAHAKTVTGK